MAGRDVAADPSACAAASGSCPSTTACPPTRRRPTSCPRFGELSGLPPAAARQRASDVLDLVGLDEARFRPSAGSRPACASARSWPRRSWPIPSSCCSTSPPRASIRSGGRRCSTWSPAWRLRHLGRAGHPPARRRPGGVRPRRDDRRGPPRAGRPDRPAPASGPGRCGSTWGAGRGRASRAGAPRRWRPTGREDASLDDHGKRALGDEVLDLRARHGGRPGPAAHALSTRHASLDEVFLRSGLRGDRRTTQPRGALGAVYDRGYRPYEGRWRAARRPRSRSSARRSAGRSACAGRGGRRCSRGRCSAIVTDAGHRQRRRRLRHPQHPSDRTSSSSPTGSTSACRRALLLFVPLTAPDVVCPDRRHRVLPLIFARPLAGVDYVLAKVGAIATIVFGFSFLPQVVLFVGQMLVSDGALDYFPDNADVLWKVPVSVAAAGHLLRGDRGGGGVADQPRASWRAGIARPRPRPRSPSVLGGGEAGAGRRINLLACRSTSATWCSSATSIRQRARRRRRRRYLAVGGTLVVDPGRRRATGPARLPSPRRRVPHRRDHRLMATSSIAAGGRWACSSRRRLSASRG